ncbi:MAG: ABC transporter substrate-binding protein [Rhodospirillaceae bacterium]|nr:ABC transporter substrate-binding protein [Rhodospirillaceae bacterium]
MTSLIRQTALALGAIVAAAFAGPAAAETKPDVPIVKAKVKMSHVPSTAYAAVYVALERGYFAKRGLEVELVIVRGGDTSYQIAGGTLQFAGGSPDSAFFNGLKRGLPLMAISSLAVNGPADSNTPLMVRKDLFESGKVKTVAQLKGMKVANLAPGGITEYLTALALKTGGLTIKDVDYVTPMGFRQMVEALKTKAIDAAILAEPFATLAEKDGTALRLSRKHDLGEQLLFIKANKEYAAKNPDVVVNFLIAYLQGARDLAGDGFLKPENVALMQKYTRLPEAAIKAATPPLLPANGEFNTASIMAQQNFHIASGRLTYKEPIAADQFLIRTYLDKAVAFLGKAK